MRKYIFSHHVFGGDRFEYTGTGGELFKGFLKVLPILAILFVPIILAELYPPLVLFYIPLIYCFGIAVYGATRYRYSRTRWRGIRGYLEGSTIKYANLAFGRLLLNIITLGFAIPSSDIAKHKYIMNNAYFGNVRAEFEGNSKVLFGAYIKSLFLIPVMMLLPMLLFALPIAMEAYTESLDAGGYSGSSDISTTMASLPGLIAAISYLFGIMLFIAMIPIARSIYTAALMREKMRGLKIGNMKFICTVGAWDLIKHKSANLFIIIFTLGLGFPYVVQRNVRFIARHHIIMGNLEAFQTEQGKDQGLTSGEGLEAGFDIDAGFF